MTNFRFLQYQFDLFNSIMASSKTVKKWQETLKCKVGVSEILDGKVKCIKCVVCSKYADCIKNMNGFSKMWIDGTEFVKKDSLEKPIKGEPHKRASDLELKGLLGPSLYQEKIVATTPIGRSVTEMVEKDKKVSMVLFINSKFISIVKKLLRIKWQSLVMSMYVISL